MKKTTLEQNRPNLTWRYCQFLEIYCLASVESQHARNFPTTVMKAVLDLDDKLEKLSENWMWEEHKLKLAGFGAPQTMI